MKIGRKDLITLLILAGIFIVIVLIQLAKPKEEVNWIPNYEKNNKDPYGAFAVYTLLPEIFPKQKIDHLRLSLYEALNDSTNSFNYIIINQKFHSNKLDTDKLWAFIENGGQVFIAAEDFEGELVEELGLELQSDLFASDSLSLHFTLEAFEPEKYYFYKNRSVPFYFKKFNRLTCKVLAENSLQGAVLLVISRGKGKLYLSSTPIAFTNYNLLLNDNREFISKSFSFLPNQTTYWDEYYKIGRVNINSTWRFILSVPSLRWAFYLTIIGVILFVLFEAKRKQRVVPILQPPANATLTFTKTIGRLYFQKRNHRNIAEKKITYFLEYIRSHFYLKTTHLDENFSQQLASKTGLPTENIHKLIQFIVHIQQKTSISEKELIFLSKQIDELKATYIQK